uniref:Short-chain dehydrogenase/reductase 3 n=1 Tax=Parastrongyloides trichosuri TaxID=131310 RepID=A0A0N5A6P0_PARTI
MLHVLFQILNFFYQLIIGCIKAILPYGILPRKDVKGKVILITGGGNGLGKNLAIAFGKLGSKVVLWDIDKKNLDLTIKQLKTLDVECHSFIVDVTNKDLIYETAKKVKETIGPVDILINNAGIANGKPFLQTTDEALKRIMDINIFSHFYTCKAFIPDMLERKTGHIVTMASLSGKVPALGIVDYSTTKFAAVGFSSALEEELKVLSNDKIKVTTICPYFIRTDIIANFDIQSIPMLPVLEPEEAVEIMMEGILTDQSQILLPKFCYILSLMYSLLPTKAFYTIVETKSLKDKFCELAGISSN